MFRAPGAPRVHDPEFAATLPAEYPAMEAEMYHLKLDSERIHRQLRAAEQAYKCEAEWAGMYYTDATTAICNEQSGPALPARPNREIL
eukprot:440323-Rhodomonas_salina.1